MFFTSTSIKCKMGSYSPENKVDVLIIGAGFGGCYLLHLLRDAGFHTHVVEAGSAVGGVWAWNVYFHSACSTIADKYRDTLEQESIVNFHTMASPIQRSGTHFDGSRDFLQTRNFAPISNMS